MANAKPRLGRAKFPQEPNAQAPKNMMTRQVFMNSKMPKFETYARTKTDTLRAIF